MRVYFRYLGTIYIRVGALREISLRSTREHWWALLPATITASSSECHKWARLRKRRRRLPSFVPTHADARGQDTIALVQLAQAARMTSTFSGIQSKSPRALLSFERQQRPRPVLASVYTERALLVLESHSNRDIRRSRLRTADDDQTSLGLWTGFPITRVNGFRWFAYHVKMKFVT